MCHMMSRSTDADMLLNESRSLLFRPLARLSHAGPEPASAADAWRRIEDFFGDHLGSGTAR